jgi:hypothetical protein
MGRSGGGDHPMIPHIKKELAKRSMKKEEVEQIDAEKKKPKPGFGDRFKWPTNLPTRTRKKKMEEEAEQVDEDQAPMYQVKSKATGKVVGTHSYEQGFKPSASSGLKSHPTNIPDGHEIDKSTNLRRLKEDQIDEGRFGKAIDPKKLSKKAQERLKARDAAKGPVKAEPGTKLGDIAASFKKPEPKKEEPNPAAKPGNKFTQLRQQNMERMKQHQAAVAAGKVGGGGDQRSGGKLGAPGDVEKKGTEIKGDRGAEHAARTGEKDAGSVVSGTTKAQSERNKRKKGAEDEHDDVHEALKGKQHKIDANHNGEIDAHDFKLLRAKHKRGK